MSSSTWAKGTQWERKRYHTKCNETKRNGTNRPRTKRNGTKRKRNEIIARTEADRTKTEPNRTRSKQNKTTGEQQPTSFNFNFKFESRCQDAGHGEGSAGYGKSAFWCNRAIPTLRCPATNNSYPSSSLRLLYSRMVDRNIRRMPKTIREEGVRDSTSGRATFRKIQRLKKNPEIRY